VQQFEALAAELEPVSLKGVYASDLTRAMTGPDYQPGPEIEPQIIPEFREVNLASGKA
jgi:broad specificity phosphatase PhoE